MTTMKSPSKRTKLRMKFFAERLEKWRWVILALIGFSLLWVEIQEFLVLRILAQPFHYFEVFQYAVLLVATGLLTELFARSNHAHKQAVKILEYKHRLGLEFSSAEDWDALIYKLAELPSKLVEVEDSCLLMSNPISGKFETVARWIPDWQLTQREAEEWDPTILCEECLGKSSSNQLAFHRCQNSDDTFPYTIYSMGIPRQNFPPTILRFKLKLENKLPLDDEELFLNIGDEITLALQASQDRKRLYEMQSAEVAMAERRIVSAYVHDQLGQNLAYMHLKLDQLGTNENEIQLKDLRRDLKQLREVANESYEIVRDILKKLQPETIPHLTNLLREHARTVSRRADFELNFKAIGSPIHLATNTQQLVFFTFREVLSNIEKHAGATKVDVLVVWNDGLLDISVTDNGKGFDPDQVQREEHFGLEIMRERIANIKGSLMINSSEESGTVVSISIPVASDLMAVPA